MDILGLAFVVISYTIISAFGVYIAKKKKVINPETSEDFILAGKQLGLFVGIFTLVATEVGGAFVNGTAEEAYNSGILWCLAPMGYAISMSIDGLFFANKLRDKKYVTLIDALQEAYGKKLGGLVFLPSCIGDVCWTAAVLSSLGTTLQVMIGLSKSVTVTASIAVAVLYTVSGGMNSVAYTDVIQILFTFFGLWLSIPFILTSDNVNIGEASLSDWTGSINSTNIILYLDTFLLLICGGVPWQPYYQRALSVKTNKQVTILSLTATWICFIAMIPSVIIGVAAKTTDGSWLELAENDTSLVLPAMISEETPRIVSLIALSAISAAVMSSVDSAMLGGGSYIAYNIYLQVFRYKEFSRDQPLKESTKKKAILVMRISMVALAVSAGLLSLSTDTIYGLWLMSGDLGYVIVFPQFLAAVHFPHLVNFYGSLVSTIFGFIFRVLVGEPTFSLGATIKFPEFDNGDPMVPVKTLIMVSSLIILLLVSFIARKFFPQSVNKLQNNNIEEKDIKRSSSVNSLQEKYRTLNLS